MNPARRTVLRFRGTPVELLDYLKSPALVISWLFELSEADLAEYEWELTRSISRHPAGKGLGR